MQYISTFSIGGSMAASTLCILSVVSRHMYLIKYCNNKKYIFRLCQIKYYYTRQAVIIYFSGPMIRIPAYCSIGHEFESWSFQNNSLWAKNIYRQALCLVLYEYTRQLGNMTQWGKYENDNCIWFP